MTDRTDNSGDEDADEDEWQFTLEDIEQREAEAEAIAEAEKKRGEPVEGGSPSLENTMFVLLGVVFAVFVLSRLVI